MESKDTYQIIQHLIIHGDLESALEHLKGLLSDPEDIRNLILLTARWVEANREFTTAQITPEDFERRRSQITLGVLKQAQKVSEGVRTSDLAGKLNSYPRTSRHFTGREEELRLLRRYFSQYTLIVVEGPPGFGKTELLANFIASEVPDRDHIIWLSGRSTSTFDGFLEQAGFSDLLGIKSKEHQFQALADRLEKHESIVFWDNFHDISDENFVAFLQQQARFFQKCRLIIITHYKPARDFDYANLEIGQMEPEAYLAYGRRLREDDSDFQRISDADLNVLTSGLHGYPMALPLALELLSYGESPDQILKNLTGYPRHFDQIRRLLRAVLDHPSTTPKARQLLLTLSVFKEKIDRVAVEMTLKHFAMSKDTLFQLIHKNMVKPSSNDAYFELHPVTREFCYEIVDDKKAIHSLIAQHYAGRRQSELNSELENNLFYHALACGQFDLIDESVIRYGLELYNRGNLALLDEMITELLRHESPKNYWFYWRGRILDLSGKPDEAIQNHNLALKHSTPEDPWLGKIYRELGWINDKRQRVETAMEYFQLALQHAKAAGDLRTLANVKGQMASCLEKKRTDYDRIFQLFDEAEAIAKELNDPKELGIILGNKGILYANLKNLEESLSCYEKAAAYFEKVGYKYGLSVAAINIGDRWLALGEPGKAIEQFEKAIVIDEQLGNVPNILMSLERIGRIQLDKNDYPEAIETFQRQLSQAQQLEQLKLISEANYWLGYAYHLSRRPEEAAACVREQARCAELLDDIDRARVFLNLGNLTAICGHFGESRNYYEKVQEFGIEKADAALVFDAKNGIGLAFQNEFRFLEAIPYYLDSCEYARQLPDPSFYCSG